MGSSHAEPMLRNNVGEWKDDQKLYDYMKNPEGVRRYWEERVRENGRVREPLHARHARHPRQPHAGAEDAGRADQSCWSRSSPISARCSRATSTPTRLQVPQIFCPYKEVLADYRAGLKVPDDVTIV